MAASCEFREHDANYDHRRVVILVNVEKGIQENWEGIRKRS